MPVFAHYLHMPFFAHADLSPWDILPSCFYLVYACHFFPQVSPQPSLLREDVPDLPYFFKSSYLFFSYLWLFDPVMNFLFVFKTI